MDSFKTWIKIGLLNSSGDMAIGKAVRLAVTEINALGIIPGAMVTFIEKQPSNMTQAVFSTVSLIQDGVIAVLGDLSLLVTLSSTLQIPHCSFSASPCE